MAEAGGVSDHRVTLPYPDRQEPTIATCSCGWTVGYHWGFQKSAAWEAERHVREKTRTDAVMLDSSEGVMRVLPGRSL